MGYCACADFGGGASKLALSTISSEALWTKSGRLEKGGQEVCNEGSGGPEPILSFTNARDSSFVSKTERTQNICSHPRMKRKLPTWCLLL